MKGRRLLSHGFRHTPSESKKCVRCDLNAFIVYVHGIRCQSWGLHPYSSTFLTLIPWLGCVGGIPMRASWVTIFVEWWETSWQSNFGVTITGAGLDTSSTIQLSNPNFSYQSPNLIPLHQLWFHLHLWLLHGPWLLRVPLLSKGWEPHSWFASS